MSEQCLELKNVCKSFRDFTLNNIGANGIVRILPLLDNAAHYCSDKQI